MTTQIAVRIADDQLEQIDRLVQSEHQSRSEVIREAVADYLQRRAAERDAEIYGEHPLSDAEVSLGDDSRNWADVPDW